jgi:phosphoglycerate dehydrogenase-like enzyme
MKVIIQKDIYRKGQPAFERAPIEFLIFDRTEPEEMLRCQRETGAKCFILGADSYPESFFNQMRENSLIARFGVGYDAIPLAICQQRKLFVSFTPGTLDDSVAELAVGFMLSLARWIPEADYMVKHEQWGTRAGVELQGKTLAIIGFGKIGRKVAAIAGNGFGMKLNAFDINASKMDGSGVALLSDNFADCVRDADFVSLHMPMNQANFNFINQKTLKMIKKSAFLINTARGKVVDEDALYDAISSGELAGAALDVYHNEPYVPLGEKDLRKLPNVVLVPHIGSNTDEAHHRMAESCLRSVTHFYGGELDQVELIPELKGF